jgi:hypothetical protein
MIFKNKETKTQPRRIQGQPYNNPKGGLFPGRSLPYEVQNHVRPNFATPMLYAKNHAKFH